MSKIIKQKQDYFLRNIHQIKVNEYLVEILKKTGKENCVLWTSAERARVEDIFKIYDFDDFISRIVYSDKRQINKDIDSICESLNCTAKQLLVFEDNKSIAKKLTENQIPCFLFLHSLHDDA
jgi:hypothetical protein